jgi:alkaline phosphatase D
LAPSPLQIDGGMGTSPIPVVCELYADEALKRLVRTIQLNTESDYAHSTHLTLEGLEPGRNYWYRFGAFGTWSPVGRAKTLPRPNAEVSHYRIASA